MLKICLLTMFSQDTIIAHFSIRKFRDLCFSCAVNLDSNVESRIKFKSIIYVLSTRRAIYSSTLFFFSCTNSYVPHLILYTYERTAVYQKQIYIHTHTIYRIQRYHKTPNKQPRNLIVVLIRTICFTAFMENIPCNYTMKYYNKLWY